MKQADVAKLLEINQHTVSGIGKTFRKTSKIGAIHKGNKPRKLTTQQERAVINMVQEQNDITLVKIRTKIADDSIIFATIHIALSTIHNLLKKYNVTMKNLYQVPVAQNTPETI